MPQTTVQRPDTPVAETDKRPLFILLDGTWAEARKMFGRSPYLDGLPVLSLQPNQISRLQPIQARIRPLHCMP
jgi:DTW domain-containing protein YfiP